MQVFGRRAAVRQNTQAFSSWALRFTMATVSVEVAVTRLGQLSAAASSCCDGLFDSHQSSSHLDPRRYSYCNTTAQKKRPVSNRKAH